MNTPIVVLGSARSNGNTRNAVERVLESTNIEVLDLNTIHLKPFNYDYDQNDQYFELIEKITQHQTIILATPVYWYNMSAVMKVFIDRLSDLLFVRKDLGRKLRSKNVFVLASFDTSLPKGFEDSFQQTCEYLGILYLGTSFIYYGEENTYLANNSQELMKARQIIRSMAHNKCLSPT